MLDYSILKFFESLRNPILNKIFIFITDLGSFEFYIIAISFLFFIFDKKISLKILFLLFISFLLNTLIKNIFKLPRPEKGIFNPIYEESGGGYGFPSGHSQNATTFWLSVSKIFKSYSFLIFSIIIISLISISRLYLSLHFIFDVFGGILIGLGIVFVLYNPIDYFIEKLFIFKYKFLISVILFIFGILIKRYSNLIIPFSGVLLGILLNKSDISKNLKIKNIILREIIGLSILILLIFISIKEIGYIFQIIIYYFSGLWISYLSHIIFSKLKI